MVILQTLGRGAQHGYGISQAIRAGSDDVLPVETGSLYPALHRLEKQGLVKSEWKQSEHNQRAKYYRITEAGKRHLQTQDDRWLQLTGAIAALMVPSVTKGEA